MSLSTDTIAALAASFGTQAIARVKSPEARALASATVAAVRSERVARAIDAYDAWRDYSATERARMDTLRKVCWPRARRVASAMEAADADARDAHKRHDRDALYDAVYRAHRLSVLLARVNARSASVGAFPLSRTDMHADTSAFLNRARYRRFMFAGGRDRVSSSVADEDVLQGAFVRAMDAGDTVGGVPTFGALFRHVQAERAHVTRMAGAEWRGIRDALHGVRPTESAYADTDDKHVMRRLGTRDSMGRPYGTRDSHAAALAIAHREDYLRNVDTRVTDDARSVSILAADERSFARILASVLMAGATLSEVSDALGLTVATIRDRAVSERDACMASGVDHTADVPASVVEREAAVDYAQSEHAHTLRQRRMLAERAASLRGAVASATGASAADRLRRGIVRAERDAAIVSAGQRVAQSGYRPLYSPITAHLATVKRDAQSADRRTIPYGLHSATVRLARANALVRAGHDVRTVLTAL